MSYLTGSQVGFTDEQVDAFSRLRVSQPQTIFDAKFTYGTEEALYFTTTSGTATTAFLPFESSFLLSVGTAAGDKVTRETYKSFLYIPGKSHSIMMTGVLGAQKANVQQQIGYFDDNDGVYFEQTGATGLSVILKSSVTGSVVKTAILQSSWNRDKLDGTGPSGITIDTSKIQIFVIDFQWLGAGRIRYGFNFAGKTVYCHEINNANTSPTTYMRTAQLPMRYVLENLGATASPTDMKQTCSTVVSEGGYEPSGSIFSLTSGDTPIALPLDTDVVIATWKLRPSINGQPNRSVSKLLDLAVHATARRPVHFQFLCNPILTGANFQPMSNPASVMDVDFSATSYTGGYSKYSATSDRNQTYVVPNFELIPGQLCTLVARAVNTSNHLWVQVNWREIG